jgi:hypothetical protein
MGIMTKAVAVAWKVRVACLGNSRIPERVVIGKYWILAGYSGKYHLRRNGDYSRGERCYFVEWICDSFNEGLDFIMRDE